jgi:iron complex transport system substrate-binding protein
MTQPLTRRAFGIAGLAGLTGLVAACGSDGSGPDPTDDTGDGASVPGDGATDTFPVTVTHDLGETVVPTVPARVVSVGVTEQDFLLALGVVPVAVTDWYGDQPHAIWPWALEALGDAEPPVLLNDVDGFDFVQIASLDPDLIVGTNAGMTEADYAKLSEIAPTIANVPGTGYFAAWQDQLALIAAAVGRSARGGELTATIEGLFADAAAAHPELDGKRAIFLQGAAYDGSVIASQDGLGTEFLTDLGLVVPSDIDEFVVEGEQAYIPVERLDVLNAADVLIWGTEDDGEAQAALEAIPGFANLEAVRAGRSIYTGPVLAGAIYFSSPLSQPYVVQELVPQIAQAFARG